MVAHNIYFFNRQGTCLYYYEWHRPKHVREGAGTPADDQKMMFGLFFSLKTFAAAMDPRKCVSACTTCHGACPGNRYATYDTLGALLAMAVSSSKRLPAHLPGF